MKWVGQKQIFFKKIMKDDLILQNYVTNIWVKVFKDGPSKICGRQRLKNFTYGILEDLDPYITCRVFSLHTHDPLPLVKKTVLGHSFDSKLEHTDLWTKFHQLDKANLTVPNTGAFRTQPKIKDGASI